MTNPIAVDTETTGLAFFDEAFGASVYTGETQGAEWYEFSGGTGEIETLLEGGKADKYSRNGGASLDAAASDSQRSQELGRGVLVFHNAKFDLQKLQLAGVLPRRKREIHDTEALAHLIDEHQPKKLKLLAKKYLGVEADEDTELKAYCRKRSNGINVKRDGYLHVPREILVPYALKDAEYTYRLYEILYPQVAKHDDLLQLYRMEMDLTWALLEMEWDGLGVNEVYVRDTVKQYARDILRTEWEIEDILGLKVWYPSKSGEKTPEGHFNPNSNDQIRAFFEGEGLRSESYDKTNLVELDHPFGNALLKLRGLKKIHSTYLLPMLEEQRDGILHPNIRQHGTRTGRMSSGKAED